MDFEDVCRNIRSCLTSSKSQLSLTQLSRDYHEVLGESIPFRSLGFNSVESLIRAVPNLRISSIRGELFIDAKPDEKTAHIANLVREQRCAKKKKRKSSRGFYRGGAPPPRRPATMPPPRRPAPPPRSSEYYPSRRRDSPPQPPQQSYSYLNQRRASPPRRPERNDYYQRRKDDSAPYQNYRNSAPIEVSSDEDNRCDYNNRRASNVDDVRRKYCSQPSQYDFSDPSEFNDEGASDFEDCEEINTRMEELKVTLGKDRKVSINKPKLRSYPSNTSNEDDFGYSSMKTSRRNGKTSSSYYETISSDSYEYENDDEDYASSTTTTTATDHLGSGDRYSSAPLASSNRGPFSSNCNRSNVYDTNHYSTDAYPKRSSRGRGYLLENAKTLQSSTSSIIDPKKGLENQQRNTSIKVTVPNGSGRARVVAFLLR